MVVSYDRYTRLLFFNDDEISSFINVIDFQEQLFSSLWRISDEITFERDC